MKKIFNLSDSLAKSLQELSKKENTTMTNIVETALTIYLMMYKGAPLQAKKLSEMIPKGQMEIMDYLNPKND